MENSNTIKDYYFKIIDLYNNCVNILTAINQSLTTNSPQVVVKINNGEDGNSTLLKIPSFIYLENKLEEISNSFNNFFDISKTGNAWFENNSNLYKFHLIKANIAPQTPNINSSNLYASYTDNNFFKDLVNPKMYLKMNVTNLTDNIEKIFVKKYVFYNSSLFSTIQNSGFKTNEECLSILYSFKKGIDYDVYDSIIDLPLKRDLYKSKFELTEIVKTDDANPWSQLNNEGVTKLNYKLKFNTLEYINNEDTSIRFLLRVGDFICLNDTNSIYKVKEVNYVTNEIIIEENIGHTALQTYEENNSMFFTIYNNNYSEYNYIQIPLEENPYIGLFIGSIYNNVRSSLSDIVLLDLNTTYVLDEYGNNIYDSYGNKISYIDYYNIYCQNIGDILMGFGEISNPLLSQYVSSTLQELQESDSIKELVNMSINTTDVLQVVPINKHLIDDSTTQQIINYHNQKNELNSKLTSLNANIDDLYNQLINTDWSQEISNSQLAIRKKLDEYYSEKTQLITQINNVIDSINAISVMKYDKDLKYRIRGILDTNTIETYISSNYSHAEIIGIDVWYRYKSNLSTTTSLSTIHTSTFTDWNKYSIRDKERIIYYDNNGHVHTEWEESTTSDNIIKWNQIDIPISANEEVNIKIRYKYNIGQPFLDMFTPWSDEITIEFPDEYKEITQISQIITLNGDDTIIAAFNKTLINDGYSEHITNKIISNNQTFYHLPENIYSGFNTPENNMLSLKDKLNEMSTDINKYKDMIDENLLKKFMVLLEFDDEQIELYSGTVNKVNINDTSIDDRFVKKQMRVIIKNTCNNTIKLYSQFPGNTDIALLEDNRESYSQYIWNYERVPLLVNDIMSMQTLGQWIYFRQNNPYTKEDIYLNEESQKLQDKSNIYGSLIWDQTNYNYIRKNNSQILYPYKEHESFTVNLTKNIWQGLYYNENNTDSSVSPFIEMTIANDINNNIILNYNNKNRNNFYHYINVDNGSNIYLMRYEDIQYSINDHKIYLDENTSINDFNESGKEYLNNTVVDYNGAFFYPDIMSKSNITIDNTDVNPYNYVTIDPGSELSIGLTLEYCLGNTVNNIANPIINIVKSLYFDIKDSLFTDPKTYMIEVEINGNYMPLNNYLDKLSILQPEGN